MIPASEFKILTNGVDNSIRIISHTKSEYFNISDSRQQIVDVIFFI